MKNHKKYVGKKRNKKFLKLKSPLEATVGLGSFENSPGM